MYKDSKFRDRDDIVKKANSGNTEAIEILSSENSAYKIGDRVFVDGWSPGTISGYHNGQNYWCVNGDGDWIRGAPESSIRLMSDISRAELVDAVCEMSVSIQRLLCAALECGIDRSEWEKYW